MSLLLTATSALLVLSGAAAQTTVTEVRDDPRVRAEGPEDPDRVRDEECRGDECRRPRGVAAPGPNDPPFNSDAFSPPPLADGEADAVVMEDAADGDDTTDGDDDMTTMGDGTTDTDDGTGDATEDADATPAEDADATPAEDADATPAEDADADTTEDADADTTEDADADTAEDADADTGDDTDVMDDEDTQDDEEDEEMAVATPGSGVPLAPVMGDLYEEFAGFDLVPPPSGTNMGVQDIPNASMLVADIEECKAFCSTDMGCNAASYYTAESDVVEITNKNCFLKTIVDPCSDPMEPAMDATAVLIVAVTGCELDGAPLAADSPLAAAAPLAAAGPVSDRGFDFDTDTVTDVDDTIADDLDVAEADTDGVVTVRGALIALAVAGVGAIAFF